MQSILEAPVPNHKANMRVHTWTKSGDRMCVAIFDGDEHRGTSLRARLEHLGHECCTFANASQLIRALRGGRRFGLLLTAAQDEVSLDGLRAACLVLGMPVLTVVPSGQWGRLESREEHIESGCTLGADISRMANEELDWLIRALIRRSSSASLVAPPDRTEVWGEYRLHESSHSVQFNGGTVTLQPRQFSLALQLFRNLGRVLERDWLWEMIWQMQDLREGTRALDACASGVRRRLELNGKHGFLMRAVYGQGYQMIEVQQYLTSAKQP